MRRGTLLALVVLCGCGGESPEPRSAGVKADSPATSELSPEERFAAVEARLLDRTATELTFQVTSEGAFAADLRGDLVMEGDDLRLTAGGTFGEDSVSLSLRAVAGMMTGSNGDQEFEEPMPAALREAVMLGLTRMGLLHNLARLVSGAPPDHAEGGVRDWVRSANVMAMEVGDGVVFDVVVDGQETASAVLRVDDRGLPVSRAQTVRFPGGEMRVREAYDIR